jgi:hypothetical protein
MAAFPRPAKRVAAPPPPAGRIAGNPIYDGEFAIAFAAFSDPTYDGLCQSFSLPQIGSQVLEEIETIFRIPCSPKVWHAGKQVFPGGN